MSERELLFSVTKDDFEIQRFRAGGKGGQGQNKRSVGVRLIHRASGARGEARDERSYEQNKRNAFSRLLNSPEWNAWYKLECARRLGRAAEIEAEVKRAMAPPNIRTEIRDEHGRWIEVDDVE
jgi:protein subunit release factor B